MIYPCDERPPQRAVLCHSRIHYHGLLDTPYFHSEPLAVSVAAIIAAHRAVVTSDGPPGWRTSRPGSLRATDFMRKEGRGGERLSVTGAKSVIRARSNF